MPCLLENGTEKRSFFRRSVYRAVLYGTQVCTAEGPERAVLRSAMARNKERHGWKYMLFRIALV